MERNTSRAAVVLALILAGVITINAHREYQGDEGMDLIRFLATKPWAGRGHNRWDRSPRFDAELKDRFVTEGQWATKENTENVFEPEDTPRSYAIDDDLKMDTSVADEDLSAEIPEDWGVPTKRSAVASAMNGRKRRRPAPALGVLNDVDSYFSNLSEHLKNILSHSSSQKTPLYTDAPSMEQAPATGGGAGMRHMYALRPMRPSGNTRTYNRRSFGNTGSAYPAANNHNPELLWTGLGRR